MSVAQLSHLIPFLESIGASPKKSLSQNFLIDQNIVSKIVSLADVQPGDEVLEIGPGPGALTGALLDAGAHVTVVEKDRVFAREIHRFQNGRLRVVEGDFLKLPISKGSKVVGNLPYSITTPILEKICAGNFSTFTFMVQKEFASRLMAQPGTKELGSITLFVQSHAEITGAFPVSKNCFHPRPSVDSTVLSLRFREERDPPELFALIRRAFQQRRKMISTSLKSIYPQIRTALQSIGVSEEARPENLHLDQWRKLFNVKQLYI
ncbi:MAG: ribosomal RNA small subunit methyltransferase A [Verrucomicrobia bacterium]|nr:ribosomal RNA small subunit methyltransferase A [Verrucomicrobiota bacterium]